MSAEWAKSEQAKYERMWGHEQYRRIAPGEQAAHHFLGVAKPRSGSTIIDFGCGTGRGAFMIALLGQNHHLKVKLLDFADNCLDDDVRGALESQSHVLSFHHADLSQPIEHVEEYGYCTDVMEHIPPEQVDTVLKNVLRAARHVYLQISCTEDACGALIGEPLHLSVHEPNWWLKKLMELECQVHYWKDEGDSCTAYVTAWATGGEIAKTGELNVEEETIRKNVRTNCEAGWQQAVPHESNNFECMILGGGPSLNGQLDEIKRLRAEGVKLVTLNGAYNWALEHGLKVSATIVVDARPFNARFTHPVVDETLYLIGSQCDPAVLEGLPRERTWLWNTTAGIIQDILEEVVGPGKWFGVQGGCTVLLRAIPLLRMLGYSKFHLFGCDSCVDTHAHHAYSQPENDGVMLIPTIVGGRKFVCTPWQIAQAQEFIKLIEYMGNEFDLEVYGEGLLAWILQHGCDLDIEAEEAAEAARVPLAT